MAAAAPAELRAPMPPPPPIQGKAAEDDRDSPRVEACEALASDTTSRDSDVQPSADRDLVLSPARPASLREIDPTVP